MRIKRNNIFSALPDAKVGEVFRTLAKGKDFRIERIVSRGQATPEGVWLRAHTDEWVAVLRGRAQLFFYGARKSLDLKPGDAVFIPALTRHRVAWTHSRKKTVWLAVHLGRGGCGKNT